METELVVSEQVKEEIFPQVDRLRIIYSASKITENTDPILASVYGYANKVIAMTYFTMADGSVGTAFFCEMKADWKPVTTEQSEENIKKLDEL